MGTKEDIQMPVQLREKLEEAGVEFHDGLTGAEIKKIEDFYRIKFPEEIKAFYMEGLPISEGFYNWRDFDAQNTEMISERISRVRIDVVSDMDSFDWPEIWGTRPENEEERHHLFITKLNEAAPIVPVYKHRYISSQYEYGNPVFSIHGTDIIYYGGNLTEYFLIEFGFENHSDIDYSKINKVDFWSEIL